MLPQVTHFLSKKSVNCAKLTVNYLICQATGCSAGKHTCNRWRIFDSKVIGPRTNFTIDLGDPQEEKVSMTKFRRISFALVIAISVGSSLLFGVPAHHIAIKQIANTPDPLVATAADATTADCTATYEINVSLAIQAFRQHNVMSQHLPVPLGQL